MVAEIQKKIIKLGRRNAVSRLAHARNDKETIAKVSLASPMFQELGPNAHALLEVVAFFPRGVNENDLDWLFPTISNRKNIFDKFCTLSLTYRSNGFATMLAPLRDYLCPRSLKSSPLLCVIKERYFSRLSVDASPDEPGYKDTQWIALEDTNVEHLLGVFTSIDANSRDVWDACAHFMRHLRRHKPRVVSLGPTIKGLRDDHPSKPGLCLYELSCLLDSVGKSVDGTQFLASSFEPRPWWLYSDRVAEVLWFLIHVHLLLGSYKGEVWKVKEALGIYKHLNSVLGRARSLHISAMVSYNNNQLDAAEEEASKVINLLWDVGDQSLVCKCHRILGLVYHSKGETEKAIDHFEAALVSTSSLCWHGRRFFDRYLLVLLFLRKSVPGRVCTQIKVNCKLLETVSLPTSIHSDSSPRYIYIYHPILSRKCHQIPRLDTALDFLGHDFPHHRYCSPTPVRFASVIYAVLLNALLCWNLSLVLALIYTLYL